MRRRENALNWAKAYKVTGDVVLGTIAAGAVVLLAWLMFLAE